MAVSPDCFIISSLYMKWSRLAKSSDFEWLGLIQMTGRVQIRMYLGIRAPLCLCLLNDL